MRTILVARRVFRNSSLRKQWRGTLSLKRRVIETVVDEVNGKVPVIAGTGCVSTRETIQLSKDEKDIGVDAAL